jgi:hypothetical protein
LQAFMEPLVPSSVDVNVVAVHRSG